MDQQLRLRTDQRQAWIVSLLLHGGGLLFLLLMILVQSIQRKPPEHVFEIVESVQVADIRNQEPTPSPMESELETNPNLPEFEPLLEPPPRPRVEIPQPQPQPQAEPEPEPQPELITAEEFRRQFGEPRPQTRPVERPRLEVPRINTDRLQESLETLVVSTSSQQVSSMNPASQDALSNYISALRSRINAVWEKPEGYGGSIREVVVVFNVAPDGTIDRVRLERGSQRDLFARSVLNAFQRVTPVGQTPGNQSYTFRMPFRMVDR